MDGGSLKWLLRVSYGLLASRALARNWVDGGMD